MTANIDAALEAATDAFSNGPTAPETGLEYVDDEELLLRKACRLRAALTELAAVNGYYTLAIEASFAIIERSMEYYIASRGSDPSKSSHTKTFEEATTAGLITDDQRERFTRLWGQFRNENYYDTGVATEQRAATMQSLAEAVHDRVVALTQGAENVCLC